jgi:hypothetical protein
MKINNSLAHAPVIAVNEINGTKKAMLASNTCYKSCRGTHLGRMAINVCTKIKA